jgi:hypothetical protein
VLCEAPTETATSESGGVTMGFLSDTEVRALGKRREELLPVGTRVSARGIAANGRTNTGTVVAWVMRGMAGDHFCIRVLRDGAKLPQVWSPGFWEPTPPDRGPR